VRRQLIAALFVLGSSAFPLHAAFLQAGNGVYRVILGNAGQPAACGSWTARTGDLHSLGAGKAILFGNSPISSYTTLHSYLSDMDYTTSSVIDCTTFCSLATPAIEQVLHDGFVVGYRYTWHFPDQLIGPSPLIELTQEIVVEGPTDGSETEENSSIRETHIVKNLGPGIFRFGLRKMWDWAIDGDDGAWFGDCATPHTACDTAMNMTREGAMAGPYPSSFIITNDFTSVGCPGNTEPVDPDGCAPARAYVVAGTASGHVDRSLPQPTPPALVQFGGWITMFGQCFIPELWQGTLCGTVGWPADDNALAYFYGVTEARAIRLKPGQSRSFTQYLGAALSSCPEPIAPGAPR
jgi:hypothetical protein